MHQIFISIFFILISLPKNTYAGNKQPSLDQNTLQSQKLFPINKWQSLNLLKQWRVNTTEIQSPILLFFNTVKKRNNKTKIQRHILQHFPSNSWRVFSNPCTVFQTLYQQNHQSILLYTPRKIAKEKSQ